MSSVLIVLIVFGFVAFIVKLGLEHEKEKRLHGAASADRALTTSELRRMIQDAVEDANSDFTKRLDALEKRLGRAPDRPQIPERFEEESGARPDEI
jgi:hypothetical protein